MGIRRDDTEFGPPSEEVDEKLKNFVRGLLTHFGLVSTERVHELAFLSEYDYFDSEYQSITDAEYVPVENGCYSSQIRAAIDELAVDTKGVEKQHVRTPGELVKSIKISSPLDYSGLDDNEIRSIEYIANEYGRIPPDKMKRILKSLAIYYETPIGEVMDFEKYTD